MRIVTAAVIICRGKLLIARRKDGEEIAGLWELPGGKVEDGETPEECLARELKEELDIDTEIGRKLGASIIRGRSEEEMSLEAYLARIKSGEPKATVHSEIRFVAIDELDGFKFCPADIPLIEAAGQMLKGGNDDGRL